MSEKRVEIPGLGRSVSVPDTAPAPKPTRPTLTKYGFPFGKYEVNGRKYWFKYNPNLMGTDILRYDETSGKGKWSRMVTKSEADAAVAAIKAEQDSAVPVCRDCGRELTDEESIRRGIGPECIKKPETGLLGGGECLECGSPSFDSEFCPDHES